MLNTSCIQNSALFHHLYQYLNKYQHTTHPYLLHVVFGLFGYVFRDKETHNISLCLTTLVFLKWCELTLRVVDT